MTIIGAREPLLALITAVTVAFGIAFVYEPRPDDPRYVFVDELVHREPTARAGERFRVHGFVEAGTIEPLHDGRGGHRFVLTNRGASLRVVMHAPRNALLKDDYEQVVTGQLARVGGEWELDTDEVATTCPGKYDGIRPPGEPIMFK